MDNCNIKYEWDSVPNYNFSEERYNGCSNKSYTSYEVVRMATKFGVIFLSGLINMNVEAANLETKFSVPNSNDYSLIDNYVKNEVALNRNIIRDQLKNEVVELAKLKDNWDGDGARRMSTTSIQHALSILDNELARVNLIDDIYPNPNGFVSIQWRNENNDIISLELGRKQMSYFTKIKLKLDFVDRRDITQKELSELYYKIASL